MLGKAISTEGKKYNVIILAGGNGTRMGDQSDYIPKALSQLGNKRAIDYIIERYSNIAHKFIIGTGRHADLLESYVAGRFPKTNIEFSREEVLESNAKSFLFCLDHADSKYGTLVLFCDLIVMSNPIIKEDNILVASKDTKGRVGTFRHTDRHGNGIMGHFCFSDTYLLKAVTYTNYLRGTFKDLTENVVMEYANKKPLETEVCEVVYEFGNENDLQEVRRLWENVEPTG